MMHKIAVCVGINKYPDPRNNLRGCVNDAKGLKRCLKKYYDFDKITLLLDHHATYKNVINSIKQSMLELSDCGHFVFSISSHGTSIIDRSGDEADRRDEAICLYDRLLVDDTFKQLLDHAPVGMKLTVISDCCHSGSITRSWIDDDIDPTSKIRYIPAINLGIASDVSTAPNQRKIFTPINTQANMREVLITGCKSDEYSYDCLFGSKYHGALSYNIIDIMNTCKHTLTYNEFYKLIRDRLPSRQSPQSPQLEGSEENKNSPMFA